MILELCGGEAGSVVAAGQEPAWRRQAHLEFARLETLGGLTVAPDQAVHLLERLGFTVYERDERHVVVQVPSWRNDIATPLVLDQQPGLSPARAQAAAEGAAGD